MTKLAELEAKLAGNQAELDAARAEQKKAEADADAALLEGGPDALLASQAGLQALSNRISVLERYAELLTDQIPAARAADARPQLEEKVAKARKAVQAEEEAYQQAVAAAGNAVAALEELNRRCTDTSAILTDIRAVAASAAVDPGCCGSVARDGAHAMLLEIEQVLCSQFLTASQMVQAVKSSARVQGV